MVKVSHHITLISDKFAKNDVSIQRGGKEEDQWVNLFKA